MIRSNQTLLKLSIELDPKNEQGGNAIAGAMRINTTITDLNLGAPGAPWPMDAATRAEVDNTLRINKFLRGVDSDANASSAAPMAATATPFPPAAQAVAAATAALQSAPPPAGEIGASVLSSPPAVPTPSDAPGASTDTTASQLLQRQPLTQSSDTGLANSTGGADSPGSMLELLRKKLDAFQGQGIESNGMLAPAESSVPPTAAPAIGQPAEIATATAAVPAAAATSAPAPQPSLAAAVDTAESTMPPSEPNESVLTPSPATTGIMISSDELQQLHGRVRAPPRKTSGRKKTNAWPLGCVPPLSRALDATTAGCACLLSPTQGETLTLLKPNALLQVDAIEARSLAQAQTLQHEWEQRLAATVAGLKAEEQTKMYMQEVRIEQLTQRLAAVENDSGNGNAGTTRRTENSGDAAVSEERVAALITSVEMLRGQISDLETQLSVVTARRNARNGAGMDGGNLPAEVDKRLRDVERGQQQSFLSMEERLAVQTEAVVERCAHLAFSFPARSSAVYMYVVLIVL